MTDGMSCRQGRRCFGGMNVIDMARVTKYLASFVCKVRTAVSRLLERGEQVRRILPARLAWS